MKSNLVDLMMYLHHRTANAVLVSETGERAKAIWLALSIIEIEETDNSPIVKVTMPEWLAKDKDLI